MNWLISQSLFWAQVYITLKVDGDPSIAHAYIVCANSEDSDEYAQTAKATARLRRCRRA